MEPFERSEFFRVVEAFRLPRYNELPELKLYMDQVIDLVERTLSPLMGDEEKWLTATMIGNYVKQDVVPRPEGKRYTRTHVAHLIFVCLVKQVMSIGDIQTLFAIRSGSPYTLETAYNYFCTEFENVLAHVFSGVPLRPDSARTHAVETRVVRSAGFAVAYKTYLAQYIKYMRFTHDGGDPHGLSL